MLNAPTKRSAACRGFSVLETLIGFTLLTLVMMGFMSLMMSSVKLGATVSTEVVTAVDASTAILRIQNALREARRFELMDGGSYGTTYLSTDSKGNVIAVSGLRIYYPGTRSNVSVVTNSSGATATLSGGNALVDPSTDGATLDVYRSDKNGTPAPSNGTCLWIKGTINGGALPTGGVALVKDISSWDGAIQFIQPYIPGTNTPMSNQVQMKITTGAWDLLEKQISSESTKGVVTTLTGQHVYLRNHDPAGATSGTSHGKTQYSGS